MHQQREEFVVNGLVIKQIWNKLKQKPVSFYCCSLAADAGRIHTIFVFHDIHKVGNNATVSKLDRCADV